MKRPFLVAVLTCICCATFICSNDAQAMYHPAAGRWLQRDPVNYLNGMNLYQSLSSLPTNRVDPNGLWDQDVHKELTETAIRWAILLQNGNPLCREWITATTVDANLETDAWGGYRWQFSRHYARWGVWTSALTAKTEYHQHLQEELANYEKELNAIGEKASDKERTTHCREALKALGRLTHSWQDFYGHAMLTRGGFAAFTTGINGSPDNDAPFSVPSWTEHGVRHEPVAEGEAEYAMRKAGAGQFVGNKLPGLLPKWQAKCGKWCECIGAGIQVTQTYLGPKFLGIRLHRDVYYYFVLPGGEWQPMDLNEWTRRVGGRTR